MLTEEDAKQGAMTELRMRDEQGTVRYRVPLRGCLRDRGVAGETNGYSKRIVALGEPRFQQALIAVPNFPEQKHI